MKEPCEMRDIRSLGLFAESYELVTDDPVPIKPCPFCGRDAELRWEFDMEDEDLFFDVVCLNPGCAASHGFERKAMDHVAAIERWNRRIR